MTSFHSIMAPCFLLSVCFLGRPAWRTSELTYWNLRGAYSFSSFYLLWIWDTSWSTQDQDQGGLETCPQCWEWTHLWSMPNGTTTPPLSFYNSLQGPPSTTYTTDEFQSSFSQFKKKFWLYRGVLWDQNVGQHHECWIGSKPLIKMPLPVIQLSFGGGQVHATFGFVTATKWP